MIRNFSPLFPLLLFSIFLPDQLHANQPLSPPEVGLGGKSIGFEKSLFGSDKYRTGDRLERPKVTDSLLKDDSLFKEAVLRTGKIRGATGFFVGIYADQFVVATNHHVCPTKRKCLGGGIWFPFLKKTMRLKSFLGTWKSIDLTLMTMKVPKAEHSLFKDLSTNFEFSNSLYSGQKLFTVGFGRANNLWGNLTYNRDQDCMVFSKKDNFKLMADPDQLNPGTYKAWSFSHGCDISHGDSGAAIFDQNTGKIIGITWTGKIPKSVQVKKSSFLRELIGTNRPEIWSELNYGVPSKKIHDILKNYLIKGAFESEESKKALKELVGV